MEAQMLREMEPFYLSKPIMNQDSDLTSCNSSLELYSNIEFIKESIEKSDILLAS